MIRAVSALAIVALVGCTPPEVMPEEALAWYNEIAFKRAPPFVAIDCPILVVSENSEDLIVDAGRTDGVREWMLWAVIRIDEPGGYGEHIADAVVVRIESKYTALRVVRLTTKPRKSDLVTNHMGSRIPELPDD